MRCGQGTYKAYWSSDLSHDDSTLAASIFYLQKASLHGHTPQEKWLKGVFRRTFHACVLALQNIMLAHFYIS
jgi:hypothetical protein